MGRKKSSAGGLAVDAPVRVRAGVAAPEFPEIDCGGWTGRVSELIGAKTDPKYVVEWDHATLARLPKGYEARCEEKGLYYRMSCFAPDELEPLADGSAE
ncbi:MAG: hypothetical protein KY476_16530 [Planctomycetes bacterium]|nr:hypothetical protein [Planctomycetota bacterium]